MEANTIAAIASAVAAGFTAIVAVIAAWITHRTGRRSTELQEQATRLQYSEELRSWAGEALQTLAEAVHLCDSKQGGDFPTRQQQLQWRLSAHVDQGRLFFPNIRENDPHEGLSSRGYRDEAVETLCRAFDEVRSICETSEEGHRAQRDALIALKRNFIRRIQRVLNPQTRDAELRRIVEPRERAKVDTDTSLLSSRNPTEAGSSVLLTARVTAVRPNAGTPTGRVTFRFMDGATPLGSSELHDGTATLETAALHAGSHRIIADYRGGGPFRASSSDPLLQTVEQG
jgi:hypothetical protein